ncbi:heat-inducible transcriptional repressor HrcA [Clostridium sp.]|uniref:heat-inducible transcriptional repressor HrcA n=1 Tax=Clostridium sp. TaxID=1506 RepID=UPI00263005B3|nr:heat-inducible transcriptional repressor HrcA [Clostridium sp.]
MIDDRKLQILRAIIQDYISTGEPVGSRTIAKKYNLGVSSATIRNEMADLEDMGFLEQPHTSSGRIPSSRGYRLYVDRMVEFERLSSEEELLIRNSIINGTLYEVDKIIKHTSSLLSELTQMTCIVKAPSLHKSFVKSIQLLKVDDEGILCVLVTDNGVIKNTVIKVKEVPLSEELIKISKIITERLKNLTIKQINLEVISNLNKALEGYEEIISAVLSALYESLKDDVSTEVFLEGAVNIFNYPEYNNISKAKEILELLHDKKCVSELIEDSEDDVTIKIGDEIIMPEAKECSIISAGYHVGDKALGTIALIGPRRINYSKVLSIMTEVMKELNETLRNK